LQITGTGRTVEEVDRENTENFGKAIKGAKFAMVEDPEDKLSGVLAKARLGEHKEENDGITAGEFDKVLQASAFFAFMHGNINDDKYWFKVTTRGPKKIYVSLPELNVESRRSTLVHMHRVAISRLLEENDNVLLTVLKNSKVTVHQSKRKYCFPKGHLLVSKGMVNVVKGELNMIFEQMKIKDVEKRVFDLKWFTTAVVPGDVDI
jgi:hypothetical protein